MVLRKYLIRADDIAVNCANWRWTESEPFPPIKRVLETPFWSSTAYATLRQRLQQPAANPTVILGGSYVTVNVRSSEKPKQVMSADPEDPTQADQSAQV